MDHKKNNKGGHRGKRPGDLPVRVSVRSQIRDLASDGEDGARQPLKLGEPDNSDAEVEVIEYRTDGILSDDGETVSLTYDESEEMGFEESVTTLSFRRSLPGTVTMVRSGGGATACRFSETERRQHCVYNAGLMPIELIVNTHAVENTFAGTSGHIGLDYSIELRGLTTERNRLSVDFRLSGAPRSEPRREPRFGPQFGQP